MLTPLSVIDRAPYFTVIHICSMIQCVGILFYRFFFLTWMSMWFDALNMHSTVLDGKKYIEIEMLSVTLSVFMCMRLTMLNSVHYMHDNFKQTQAMR